MSTTRKREFMSSDLNHSRGTLRLKDNRLRQIKRSLRVASPDSLSGDRRDRHTAPELPPDVAEKLVGANRILVKFFASYAAKLKASNAENEGNSVGKKHSNLADKYHVRSERMIQKFSPVALNALLEILEERDETPYLDWIIWIVDMNSDAIPYLKDWRPIEILLDEVLDRVIASAHERPSAESAG